MTSLATRLLDRVSGARSLDLGVDASTTEQAASWWSASSDTYLGSPAYYEARQAAIGTQLMTLATIGVAVDVGCGDGRYTVQIAAHADVVEGRDISPVLIAAAGKRGGGVAFTVAGVEEGLPADRYDLVTAFGVTSCLPSDEAFAAFIADARRALRPGGHLLTIDSLSLRGDSLVRYDSGYVARYRPIEDYRAAFVAAGFRLQDEAEVGDTAKGLVRFIPYRRRTNQIFRWTTG